MRLATLLSGAACVFVLDQAAKALVVSRLDEPWTLGPLTLRLAYNEGIAFGALKGVGSVVLFAVLALALMLAIALRADAGPAALYGLVLGGGLSNVTDRLARGHVVDFIDIGRWPVFNLADTAISAGVVLLLIMLARERKAIRADSTLPSPADGD